jgi:hypothetical protein
MAYGEATRPVLTAQGDQATAQRPLIRRTSISPFVCSSQLSIRGHHLPELSCQCPRQIGEFGQFVVMPCRPGSESLTMAQQQPGST